MTTSFTLRIGFLYRNRCLASFPLLLARDSNRVPQWFACSIEVIMQHDLWCNRYAPCKILISWNKYLGIMSPIFNHRKPICHIKLEISVVNQDLMKMAPLHANHYVILSALSAKCICLRAHNTVMTRWSNLCCMNSLTLKQPFTNLQCLMIANTLQFCLPWPF